MTVSVILAVDDRVDNLFVLEQLVRAYLPEIKMISAESAESGLKLAVSEAVDGALIDVQMPKMSGIEMCRRLKADPRTASIHVILVTAHQATSELKAQGLEAGADDFITKPIDNVELAAKLKVMLRLRSAEDALRLERDHLEERVRERALSLVAECTQREQVEDSLARTRLYQELILNSVGEGILGIDLEEQITFANPAAVKMLGYEPELILGQPFHLVCLFSQSDGRPLPKEERPCCATLRDGKDRSMEGVFCRQDGASFPGEGASTAITEKGKITGAVITFRDITERQRSEKALLESLARTQEVQDGTIQALATVTETRDPYTAGHQRRVAQLACAVAQELGFPADRVAGLRVMGLLHDLGKISIPAEILSKPGKLSEMEFNIIKSHVQAGYEIVKEIRFPWPVAEIVLQHHERLDGSGYPQGLQGGEIVLEAKILAVADVVEAMSSNRPYRPGLGIDKALDEIDQNKGVLYEPEVVDACLKLFSEKGFQFD